MNEEQVTYTITVPKDQYPFPPNSFVLGRDDCTQNWTKDRFLWYRDESTTKVPLKYCYCTAEGAYVECIPYEGNEHLEGTNLPEGLPKESPWIVTVETSNRDVIASFCCKCGDDASYLSEALENYAINVSSDRYNTPHFIIRGHKARYPSE